MNACPAVAEAGAQRGIAEQSADRGGKLGWRIGDQEMLVVAHLHPLRPRRRRDDRAAHRQRVEQLEARATAVAHRQDVDGCPGEIRAIIGDRAGDGDAGMQDEPGDLLGWVAPDQGEAQRSSAQRILVALQDRPDLLDQPD